MGTRLKLIVLLIVLLIGSGWSSRAAAVSVQTESGTEVVHALVKLFCIWSGDARSAQIFSQAAQRIDYKLMAEEALSPQQWAKLSAKQRAEYISLFQGLVQRRYYVRWHKLFQRSKLVVASETRVGDEIDVKTYMTTPQQGDDTIVWRLHQRAGQSPMVLSLAVNGNDLLTSLGPHLQKQYDARGYQGVIDWIKRKTQEMSADTKR